MKGFRTVLIKELDDGLMTGFFRNFRRVYISITSL